MKGKFVASARHLGRSIWKNRACYCSASGSSAFHCDGIQYFKQHQLRTSSCAKLRYGNQDGSGHVDLFAHHVRISLLAETFCKRRHGRSDQGVKMKPIEKEKSI